MVPICPTPGIAAQFFQRLAGRITHSIGIVLWSGWAISPALLRMPRQGATVGRKRIDSGTLRARPNILVPEVLEQGERAGSNQILLSAFC